MSTILLHPGYCNPIIQYAAIAQASEVVFEMHDNFQKQTYRTRLKIATSTHPLVLSIPIKHIGKEKGRQKTKDVRIENKFHWQRDHWRSFKAAYQTSPYFEYYEDTFKPLYHQEWEKLIDFLFACHEVIMECLQLEVPTRFSESYEMSPTIKDYRHLINARKEPDYNLREYHQLFGDKHGFLSNLTILDLLFNEGTNALTYLEAVELNF